MVKKRLEGRIPGAFNDSLALNLAKRLAFFPLYMDQVSSFIESTKMALDQFDQICPGISDDELQCLSPDSLWHSSSVAQAIEAPIVMKLDRETRRVLATISFFDPDQIPEKLLISATGEVPVLSTAFRSKQVLLSLARYSLIYLDVGEIRQDRCISLHRLVRDAALRLEPNPQAIFDDAVKLLRDRFPLHGLARDHMVEQWDECETFQPHVLALHRQYQEIKAKECLQASFDFIELVYSCAWYVLTG